MRADPDLCFLERVGMPDITALSAEHGARGEGIVEMTDRCAHTHTHKNLNTPALSGTVKKLY